jgi:hypothetical protein
MHGFYRLQALIGFALEQRRGEQVLGKAAPDAAPLHQAAE